jgi:hypothetical protein
LGDSGSGGQLGLSEASELAGIPKHARKVHTLYFSTSTRQILCEPVLAQ